MDSINDFLAYKAAMGDDDRHDHCCDDCCHRRRIDGGTATALAAGFAGLGIVIFGGLGLYAYSSQQGKTAQLLANANNQRISDSMATLQQLNATLLNEVNARQLGDSANRNEANAATNRVNDKVDIISTTASNAAANASALASIQQQILADTISGKITTCPQPISIFSAPQPCPCPASNGCCNG